MSEMHITELVYKSGPKSRGRIGRRRARGGRAGAGLRIRQPEASYLRRQELHIYYM